MVRVLVTGGRDYNQPEFLNTMLDKILEKYPDDLEIVCGDAEGADAFAYAWARAHQVTVHVYAARWDRLKKRAGPIRNQEMIDAMKPDMCLVFPGGRGTLDCSTRAAAAGIPLFYP